MLIFIEIVLPHRKDTIDDVLLKSGSIFFEQVDAPGKATIHTLVEIINGEWYAENLPEGRYRIKYSGVRITCKSAEVVNNQQTRLDFRISTGTAQINGYIYAKGCMTRSRAEAPVYLYLPGACSWKTGQVFIHPNSSDGLFAQAWNKRNVRYCFSKIPQGTYDLVAINLEEGKIKRIEKKKITLMSGEKLTIDFNLLD